MADTQQHVNNFKRKRKKSFLKKQKQHGKKGRFGQGLELSEENYQYFIRILEVIKSSKDSAEEMEMLACNVLEEMEGNEVDICSNQLASRVVEEVLTYAPDNKLPLFTEKLGSAFRLVFTDPYCSHVLQKLIQTLATRILDAKQRSEETLGDLKSNFIRIAMFALNNLEDFMFDTYANHVLRTLFACVNGHAVKTETIELNIDVKCEIPVPDELEDLAKSFVKKVLSWPQFNDLTNQVLPSGCLQSLAMSVRGNTKLSKLVVKKIIDACDTTIDLTEERYQPLLHLIEAGITIAPPKLFNNIYELLFKENLKTLVLTKTCNFAVQKLVTSCPVKETFEGMFSKLVECFPSLLKEKYTGVLLALAKGCRIHKTKQGEFSKALFSLLKCDDAPERHAKTTPLICSLTPFENYTAETKVHLHGSLIFQEMLYFAKPVRLVTSLLAMPDNELITLLSDPRGCHVTDAFVASQFVGEKNRERLFKKLQRHYVALAASKHGSRTFDAVWSILTAKQKSQIMDELKSQQSAVVAPVWGKVIVSKTRLDLYRQDKEKWMKLTGADSVQKGYNEKKNKGKSKK